MKKQNSNKAEEITQAFNLIKDSKVLELEAKLAEQDKFNNTLSSYVEEINKRTDNNGKPKRFLGFLQRNYLEIIPIVKLIIKLIIANSKNQKVKNFNVDTILN